MRVLREIYERVAWWRLQPRPVVYDASDTATVAQPILAKAERDDVVVVYFPPGARGHAHIALDDQAGTFEYESLWCNPRNGETAPLSARIVSADGTLVLPAAPDSQDWLLIMRRNTNPIT
jgi:hypothetical protein